MTKWLKEHKFSYKHPKNVPAKADLAKQEEFIEKYLALVADTPLDEPILFMDTAHPTMATKVVCGWIKEGVDKPIGQNGIKDESECDGSHRAHFNECSQLSP